MGVYLWYSYRNPALFFSVLFQFYCFHCACFTFLTEINLAGFFLCFPLLLHFWKGSLFPKHSNMPNFVLSQSLYYSTFVCLNIKFIWKIIGSVICNMVLKESVLNVGRLVMKRLLLTTTSYIQLTNIILSVFGSFHPIYVYFQLCINRYSFFTIAINFI